MQYEGPGVEMLFSPSEDGDAHNLLRLRQRFSGVACCLGLLLRYVSERWKEWGPGGGGVYMGVTSAS